MCFTVMLKLKLVFPFVKTSNLKPPKPSHQTLRNAIFLKKTNVISKILDFKRIGKKLEVADFQKKVSENDWVTNRKVPQTSNLQKDFGATYLSSGLLTTKVKDKLLCPFTSILNHPKFDSARLRSPFWVKRPPDPPPLVEKWDLQ